jgi:dUTP pyrophosphatase
VDSSFVNWKVLDARAAIPERKTASAAGFDLCVLDITPIEPGTTVRAKTGLACALPYGTVGFIKPRSSAYFRGLDLDGTVDSDYRGEVLLQIRNTTAELVVLSAGERVAQMVVTSIFTGPSKQVESLDETGRGEGGFGSTGR